MEIYKNIKDIRVSLKEIEFESQKLKKDIKKKEKERKLFVISTVVLKKYSSYLSNNLINLTIHNFNYVFIYSCGILFTNTIFENDNKEYSNNLTSNISNFFQQGKNEKIIEKNNKSWINIKNQKILTSHVNEHLEKKKKEEYKERNQISSKKKKFNNKDVDYYNFSLKNHKESIESVKSEGMQLKEKNTFFNIRKRDNSVNVDTLYKKEKGNGEKFNDSSYKNTKILKKKMWIDSYEQIRNKKKKKIYNNFPLDKKHSKEEINFTGDGLNNSNYVINNTLLHKNNFSNLNKNYEQKIRDNKEYKKNISSNQSLIYKSWYYDLYKDKNKNEKKNINSKSHIDSYMDIIKNGKVFSFFENKMKTKNPFVEFMSQIKNIFFINQNKDNNLKEIEEKKEKFNILKYQCLIKSKKVKIYLCVCPNCSKNFYLLIKKSSNKKLRSKVFPPSHFSSLVSDLRKQKADLLNGQNIQKYENFSDKKKFYLDINSVEYFYEFKSFNDNENYFDFCSCYIKIEKNNNFFDNLDMLLYI